MTLSDLFEKRESAAWTALPLSECKNPKSSTFCEPVKAFLKKYPNGPHSAEGTALLREMEPALSALYEEETWISIRAANPECRDRTFTDPGDGEVACISYREYLQEYPTGVHAKEAREILTEADKHIAKLKREEDEARRKVAAELERQKRAVEQAERAQAAREAAEERKRCIGQCKVVCSGWQIANQSACFSGCVDSKCSGGSSW